MSKDSIQTKREAGKKSGLKILHAKTIGRRKQRAVAASPSDLGSDVPNVGIGRALIVILVLHVVAIGAVIMHTSWTDGQGESFSGKTPAVVVDAPENEEKTEGNSKSEDELKEQTAARKDLLTSQSGMRASKELRHHQLRLYQE